MCACEHIREVSAYHDGELPPEDARRLESHLAQCAVCARELRELGSLSRVLTGVAAPDAPAKVIERLHGTVGAAREVAVMTLAKGLIAAAAAVLIICAVWIWGVVGAGQPGAATASSWEWAAVTLRDQASSDTQQIAQWIVNDLSLEKRHD